MDTLRNVVARETREKVAKQTALEEIPVHEGQGVQES
jgi:hypothetical protein